MLGKDIYTNYGTVGLTEWPDGDAGRSGRTEKLDGVARRSGPTEKLDGATRVAHDTQWASMADGHLDGCPTEGGRAPDGGRTGARWRVGVARRRARWTPDGEWKWPDGGCDGCPTFLGTLILRPVAPARNAGAQGANE
jgi:hypothetical protein